MTRRGPGRWVRRDRRDPRTRLGARLSPRCAEWSARSPIGDAAGSLAAAARHVAPAARRPPERLRASHVAGNEPYDQPSNGRRHKIDCLAARGYDLLSGPRVALVAYTSLIQNSLVPYLFWWLWICIRSCGTFAPLVLICRSGPARWSRRCS